VDVTVIVIVLSAAEADSLTSWTVTRLSSSSETAHMEVLFWRPSQTLEKKLPLKS